MRGQLLLELESSQPVFLVGRQNEHGWMYLYVPGWFQELKGRAFSTDVAHMVTRFDDEATARTWISEYPECVVVAYDPKRQRVCNDCRAIIGIEAVTFAEDLAGMPRLYCADCRKIQLDGASAWAAKRAARAKLIADRRST